MYWIQRRDVLIDYKMIEQTKMVNIQEFNENLVENGADISIKEYIEEVNDAFHQIDIDFVDDFMNLVKKDECCIHQDMLVKYGVLSSNTDSRDVKRILQQYNMKSDIYWSGNVAVGNCCHFEKHSYKLHPDAFKKILMRCKTSYK